MATKTENLKVEVRVTVPVGTSRTRVEKALSTLLKSSAAPEGFKIGSPKVAAPQIATLA